MPGQAHSPSRRLLATAALSLTVLALPALGAAAGGSAPGRGAAGLRAHDASLAAEARSATLDLYAIDQQLGDAQTRLASLDAEASRLRAERRTLALQLAIVRRGAVLAQRHLASHLRTVYERGSVSGLDVLIGSRTLDDALTGIENLDRISSQDRAVLLQVVTARTRLAATARSLAARASALAAATRDAAATAASLDRARSERSAFIASLAAERRLTATQIAAVVAAAHAAQKRTQALTRAAATQTAPATLPVRPFTPVVADTPGGRLLTVSATGYAIHGRTATGLETGWGIAAVDPSVIPLGTHMTVPGYGEAVAADVGGSVTGATIDLWFPTVAQADAWGRRTVTIVLHP